MEEHRAKRQTTQKIKLKKKKLKNQGGSIESETGTCGKTTSGEERT